MTLKDRIRQLRVERGFTQSQLAAYLGVGKSTLAMYEAGRREPSLATLDSIADFFNVDIEFLLGKSECRNAYQCSTLSAFFPLPDMSPVPLVGQIACGTPITAEENVECIVNVPTMWHADFALTCKGDSMAPKIQDGDLVAIRSQPQVDNGDIAAVLIDGEATLKRVYCYPDHMLLQAENAAYDPIILMGAQMSTVLIEGKAVGFCRGL